MTQETDEPDRAPPSDKRGPNGEKPLAVTKRPQVELNIESSQRRNLWAKGDRVAAKAQKSTGNPSRKAKAGPLATKIYYDDVYHSSREGDETWDPLESTCRHASLSIL